MSFAQNNSAKRDQKRVFEAWLDANRDLIAATGLPSPVFETRDDWAYFACHGYHDTGNWHSPPFTAINVTSESLDVAELQAVKQLGESWDEWCIRHPILEKLLPSTKWHRS